MANKTNILEVTDLRAHFVYKDFGTVKAVDGVDFNIIEGETMGLVGESGCGKSVTALSIMRLMREPPAKIEGRISLFTDVQEIILTDYPQNSTILRDVRGHKIGMVFQEPMTSLNPVISIGKQISETLILHRDMNKQEARGKAVELLKDVGIDSPEHRVDNYPNQLSGGMRQRALIAMAISCNPQLLIADEPTTALDVTIQAQILELLKKIQDERGMSILMITHDLGVISEMCQHVAVMYLGKIVENSSTVEIFDNPLHPYTQGLLNSIPLFHKSTEKRKRIVPIIGNVPEPYDAPEGCSFTPRCPKAMDMCSKVPPLIEVGPNHRVRCWLYT